MKNKILVVTGMHRSGTSLITQWLQRCGLHVGDELLGADTGNDNGHFEDLDFLNSHKALLKSRRLSDNGFTSTTLKPLSHEEKDKIRDIIKYKNGFNQEWAWKDPRTCLFLDAYHNLIPDAFYFVVLRSYEAVISSMILRMYKQKEDKYASKKGLAAFIWNHFTKKKRMDVLKKKYSQRFLEIWIAYNQAILQHIKKLPQHNFIVADFTILFDNDKKVYEHLTNTWDFSLQFFDFRNIYKAGQVSKSFIVEPFIKDKSLIAKATGIEEALRKKSIFNSTIMPVAVV